MIIGEIHPGSGLGNQLHRYIATRVLALDKGYEFGFRGIKNFKGNSFLNLEWGIQAPKFELKYYNIKLETPNNITGFGRFQEKCIRDDFGNDIRGYDPEINFIEDNTVIDGEFQDERYFEHRLPEIKEWLKVEPLDMPENRCVINYRGGEYKLFPDLYLTKEYWDNAIKLMQDKYPDIEFEVHTDDVEEAERMLGKYPIYHSVGLNWRAIRYAKHLIISNSSFAILPALLGDAKEIIAPRFWARRNTKTWALPQNYYKRFLYI